MKSSEKELEKIIKAFANYRRIQIVKYLKRIKVASVGKIAEEIKLSFRSTSRHLGVLYRAGIVDKAQENLNMNYSLEITPSSAARKLIDIV